MSDTSPWLLVGLGNPGRKYEGNRHNVGFMVVERFVDRYETPGVPDSWKEKFHGRYASVRGDFGRAVVLEPQTYMNRSGKSVQAAKSFFGVPDERIVVVHDEIDFDFGRVGVKRGGGHGGHNGLRDIIAVTGSRDFARIRVGVGRPPKGPLDVSAWVLADFSAEDRADLPDVVDRAQSAATAVLTDGVAKAMNAFNQSPDKPPKEPRSAADKAASSASSEGDDPTPE